MRIIPNHFEDKNTEIAMIDGEIFIHNGRHVFNYKDREVVYKEFNVPQSMQDDVEKEIELLQEENADINFFKKYHAFCQIVKNEDVQHILAKSDNELVLRWLASNSNICVDVQHILSKSDNELVLRWLAGNSNICVDVQHILAKSDNELVLRWLASNSNICVDVQHILSKSEYEWVLCWLAGNSNICVDVKNILKEEGYYV